MTTRLIALSSDEVSALLLGAVTLLRPVTPQPPGRANVEPDGRCCVGDHPRAHDCEWEQMTCPLGVPGDTFTVLETWWTSADGLVMYDADQQMRAAHGSLWEGWGHKSLLAGPLPLGHRASDEELRGYGWRKQTAESMPDWASRLTAKIVSVGCKRMDGPWTWIVECSE